MLKIKDIIHLPPETEIKIMNNLCVVVETSKDCTWNLAHNDLVIHIKHDFEDN